MPSSCILSAERTPYLASQPKFLFWSVHPNEHQGCLFAALHEIADLRINYCGPVPTSRLQLGWNEAKTATYPQTFVEPNISALYDAADWKNRIHVVPGYATSFRRNLIRVLSRSRVPWIHWSEDSTPGLGRIAKLPLKRWYASMVNRFALGAFGTGLRAMLDIEAWGVRADHIAFLPYCTPVTGAHPEDMVTRNFAKGRKSFIYIGRLEQAKGTALLIDAFGKLAAQNWVLVLLGLDNSDGRYRSQVARLGLNESVLFRGAVGMDQVAGVIKCADVVVHPSLYDGWGAALAEGLVAGKALIGSIRAGATIHLVRSGENGFWVDPQRRESLSAAMMAYVEAPTLARQHGSKSKDIAEIVSPGRNAERILRIVESWISKRNAHASIH